MSRADRIDVDSVLTELDRLLALSAGAIVRNSTVAGKAEMVPLPVEHRGALARMLSYYGELIAAMVDARLYAEAFEITGVMHRALRSYVAARMPERTCREIACLRPWFGNVRTQLERAQAHRSGP